MKLINKIVSFILAAIFIVVIVLAVKDPAKLGAFATALANAIYNIGLFVWNLAVAIYNLVTGG